MPLDQQIQKIHSRVQQLLRERDDLRAKNGYLKKEIEHLQQQQAQQAETIAALRQQANILKLAAGQLDDTGKKELEKTINRYLKEIDRAIALLAE